MVEIHRDTTVLDGDRPTVRGLEEGFEGGSVAGHIGKQATSSSAHRNKHAQQRTLAAGSHTIRVVRDGYETWERTIQVGAGETVRLTDIALTARP